MTMKLKSILSSIQHVFFPQFCTVCGAPTHSHSVFCTKCQYEMPRTRNHEEEANKTANVLSGRVPFARATSLFYYNKGSFFTRPIFQLKYYGKTHIGKELGRMLGAELISSDFLKDIDYIVPVPLHPKKLKKRGFNQCSLIAEGIKDMTGIEVSDEVLIRTSEGNSQTTKNRSERWESLKHAFEVAHPEKLSGKHILLIDDVITTGATIEASANALSKIDGINLSVASVGIAMN